MSKKQKVQQTLEQLKKIGFQCSINGRTTIEINHKGSTVLYYPIKEWFSGKSVEDGRGFENLISQLTNTRLKAAFYSNLVNHNSQVKISNYQTRYWIIDKNQFREQGKVFIPLLECKSLEDARIQVIKHINCCVTKTVYCKQNEKVKIKFQQIVR